MPTAERQRALVAPLLAVGAAAAGAGLLLVRDPRTSTYLPCPFHAVTGLWCPGCGATRAFGALVRGDVASAMSSNLLALVLVVLGVGMWITWVRARLSGTPVRQPPKVLVFSAAALVLAFTIVRNVPAGSWLAP